MKALQFRRDLGRYAAARIAGTVAPGRGARVGPLRLRDVDLPELPADDWVRVRPRLAGICGSDLATVDGRSSRYFEPIVSFPFIPGHEVVGNLDDETRVVVEPVLGCVTRSVSPPCGPCASGDLGNCERIAFGSLKPGLQTGFCADTGGGWATALVAHPSQLHTVPDALSDEQAVMVEPAACAVHAALAAHTGPDSTALVQGAGTLGLLTLAALRRYQSPGTIIVVAKHARQRSLASELGADLVVQPDGVARAVRRVTGTLAVDGGRLTGGCDVVFDCVGNESTLDTSLAVVRPRGRVVLAGMPGVVRVDLTALWHQEIELVGAYAYGTEHDPSGTTRRTFEMAFDLVGDAELGRLVSALYPLDRYREAIEHAAEAGSRGAVKVAFDLRDERERTRL